MSKRLGYNRFGLRRFDMLHRDRVTDGVKVPACDIVGTSVATFDRPIRAKAIEHINLYLEQTKPGSVAYFQLIFRYSSRKEICVLTDRSAFCFCKVYDNFALIQPRTFWPEEDFQMPTLELLDQHINKELEDAADSNS